MAIVRKSRDNEAEEITGTLMVIGDLHTSPRYHGRHKNYWRSCQRVLEMVRTMLEKQVRSGKQVSLMILGDTFGVNERNFNDEFALQVVGRYYKAFNRLCNNRVYSVRGNHDMGEYTTFDYAKDEGWIRNPEYIDMVSAGGKKIARMHIVNYGHEHRKLDLLETGENVVFGHNDYVVEGITPVYGGKTGDSSRGDRVLLSGLDNFIGVCMVVEGHIHTPLMRDDILATMKDGSTIQLVIPGSPSRVAERNEQCYSIIFDTIGEHVDYHNERIDLWPNDEEFEENEATEEEQAILADAEARNKEVRGILEAVMGSRAYGIYDIPKQIESIPGFNEDSRRLALEYYRGVGDRG